MADSVVPVDRFAILRTLAALEPSPTAGSLVDQALASGVELRVVDDAEMDRRYEPSTMGQYLPDVHAVELRRSIQSTPQGVQTMSHELLHAVDRRSAPHAALMQRLDAAYLAEGWTDVARRGVQVRYHASLVREARAYVLQAQVRRELGIPASASFHRAISDAPTELAAYQAAWAQLVERQRLDQPIEFRDVPPVFMPGSTLEDPV